MSTPNMKHQPTPREVVKTLEIQLDEETKTLYRCECVKCCKATDLGRKALDESRKSAASVKRQRDFLDLTPKSNAKLSRCNRANAMQDVDTPGCLDMHHPLALSMTPAEPPAVPQTVDCWTPSFPTEARHSSQRSKPFQLSPQAQSLSQSLSETAGSVGTAPRTSPKLIEIQPKPQSPQNGSPSKGSGAITKSSTRAPNPIRASRFIMGRVVKIIKNTTLDHWKPTKSTSSCYSEVTVHLAHARRHPPVEVAFEIVTNFAEKKKQGSSFSSSEDQLMFYCLCKVLYVMGVKTSRLQEIGIDLENKITFEKYFKGVVWVNLLLQDLENERWGHQAVDLLLSWDISMIHYVRFGQSGTTSVHKNLKTSGPRLTKTVRPNYRKSIMEFLKNPKYRAKCLLTLNPESESLPARVGKILHGIVSDSDICIALRCHQVVEGSITWHESQPVAKLNWSASQDNGCISPISSSRPDTSRDSRSIESSRQAQSSSNGGTVAPTNDIDMLADSVPTCSSVPAVQNLNWSVSHNYGYTSSPYSSGPNMSNNTISINSSHQAQGYSNARDLAPTNDIDMLGDSATTGTNPQASEELQWIIGSNLNKIAYDSWNDVSIAHAQSAWEATNAAYANDYDVLGDSTPSMPNDFDWISEGNYRAWVATQTTQTTSHRVHRGVIESSWQRRRSSPGFVR